MSNEMPIYSQVAPKYRDRGSKPAKTRDRTNPPRGDFDPLNYNNGGQFLSMEPKYEKPVDKRDCADKRESTDKRDPADKRESRRSKDDRTKRVSEGKVEAYLRQNQVNIRQHQNRQSTVKQAEHRVNLRSLPLNEVTSRHDRTPTDRQRPFPERERERDGAREHRRERDKDRANDYDFSQSPTKERSRRPAPAPPDAPAPPTAPAPTQPIPAESRPFLCREWVFQKLAQCLEQRAMNKTAGVLILGDAGSGKTALCRALSDPPAAAHARQQRALQRRLLARYYLQGNSESSLAPGEFVRSLAMQILSHSTRAKGGVGAGAERAEGADGAEGAGGEGRSPGAERRGSDAHRRFPDLSDDAEESAKPLLGDSEDQHTDEDEPSPAERRARTIDRVRETEDYLDAMIDDAVLSRADELPEIFPRAARPTNPFITDDGGAEGKIYENHENLFLQNVPRAAPAEPERSPPKSRIPVAAFHYPNKSELRVELSPAKTADAHNGNVQDSLQNIPDSDIPVGSILDESIPDNNELPEYTNVLKPSDALNPKLQATELEILLEKKRCEYEDEPPPIPSLPISARTLIANAYYDRLLADPEVQQALLPHSLQRAPDAGLRRALLRPLALVPPPKQALFVLVDGIGEGAALDGRDDPDAPSRSVAALLARHAALLPPWLLLVCTAPRLRPLTKMFTGFRKITLDELRRGNVSADVQRYVLARLAMDPRLRSRVSSDAAVAATAAAALDHLRIKSDGCLLYLEKVLDGVADGFIALREIREIPGTLNGLYLWLAQRLFHGRRFAKVRPLLDVLLAARRGVTEDLLYRCLLTREACVTREDFGRRLHLLRRVLVLERATGYLTFFHHSFALWLGDVKHCGRRYLCCPLEGAAALAMYYTLCAPRLSALEVHNYVLHMTQVEQLLAELMKTSASPTQLPVDLHTLVLLWILDSGCDVDAALKKESSKLRRLAASEATENKVEDVESDDNKEMDTKESPSPLASPLAGIVPSLSGAGEPWPADARVLRALLELAGGEAPKERGDEDPAPEEPAPEPEPEPEAEPEVTEALIDDLSNRGDDDALEKLVERGVHLPSLPTPAPLAAAARALHRAARAGRARAAAALLRLGAPPDCRLEDGWTPLRAAAWAGHVEVVDVLLESGCDVDCVDSDNRTALRACAWSGHEAVVARLLAAGAAPDKPDAEGRTPLLAAAYMGHREIVDMLLKANADVNHADEDGRTALCVAALCDSGAPTVALLLERGADVTARDRDGAHALLVAAFEGHTDICELLLEAEAPLEAGDATGRSPLWAAAAAGHAAAVRLLLYWGAGVDAMDAEGRTVLSAVAAHGNAEVVRQLLDRGLDENHRDNSGWTPLHYAAFEGHIEVCEALLEAGARIEEADNEGKRPLAVGAQEGHAALVAALLDRGADGDAPALDQRRPLRLAALEGHFDTVRLLLSRGADVDAADADGRSTLYVLALENKMAMARFLLTECNAKVDTRDAEGRTPLHVSSWQGHNDMVNLLIKIGGADVNAGDRSGRTALHAAAWRGRAAALRTLLRSGARHDAVCEQQATPLGIAAQEGHSECVLYLLQHGADPLQADNCGRTPAKVAWRAGHADICRLLERWAAPSAPAEVAPVSPESKRRSVHSTSTKSSDHDSAPRDQRPSRANLSLSFAQQVARCGRGRRDRDRDSAIPEHSAVESDGRLRSYAAHARDGDIRSLCERDGGRGRAACERDGASPLYASPPRSPVSDVVSPMNENDLPPMHLSHGTDQHFNRDTHMRIILGRDSRPPPEKTDSEVMWLVRGRGAYRRVVGSLDRARGRIFKKTKSKRNGIVTNPAMRLVNNVRNGLDNAAANIRRAAANAGAANPAVRTNAFHWRKETPL